MKKIVLLAAVAALFVSMLAVPASAHPVDVGVFGPGTADVGKTPCGAGGGGLGLPNLNGKKNAYYGFNTPVTSAGHGAGNLNICGRLENVLGNVADGLGAWCGMSKAHSGVGTLKDGAGAVHFNLSQVGWKATAGGTLPVMGKYAGHVGNSVTGTLYAIVQAQGGAGCVNKNGNGSDKGGAVQFTVVGAAAFVDGAQRSWNNLDGDADKDEEDPTQEPFCKGDPSTGCLYSDKK